MKTCTATTRAEAWLEGAKILLAQEARVYNLVVEVEQPDLVTERSRAIETRVDEFLAKRDRLSIHSVAETIFPATEYRSGGLAKVYAYPDTIFPEIKSYPGNGQGTYALRLVHRQMSNGKRFNALETVIDKLRRQLKRPGPQRAVYELDLNMEALELKFYDPEIDESNLRGGQCLSHVSLKLGSEKELYLTSLYRYQYFAQKALGNLKGLARLQACIAREVGIPVGPLVCHATMAVLDDNTVGAPWRPAEVKKLVEECDEIAGGETIPKGMAA